MNRHTRDVVNALLHETSPHRDLYLTNAWFKHALDHFVDAMLPMFVDGLAANAVEQDAKREQHVKDIMSLVSPRIFLSDDEAVSE